MRQSHRGIASLAVAETPIAVFDVETTGLSAGVDRVVEISVVRIEPGGKAELVLDTLVNPIRAMAATEIHGISDEDVADAPAFKEIAGDVIHAISDCVVAAYNVYFDIKFLQFELKQADLRLLPPHFCLMYMSQMLGLGGRCSLNEACRRQGIHHGEAHTSADDARAAAGLFGVYLNEMARQRIRTFGDLARSCSYKFIESFSRNPFTHEMVGIAAPRRRLTARSQCVKHAVPSAPTLVETAEPGASRQGLRTYGDALMAVVSDLKITDDEIQHLRNIKRTFALEPEHIRALHARIFAMATLQFVEDRWLDKDERSKLRRLHECLSQLGWAPGE